MRNGLQPKTSWGTPKTKERTGLDFKRSVKSVKLDKADDLIGGKSGFGKGREKTQSVIVTVAQAKKPNRKEKKKLRREERHLPISQGNQSYYSGQAQGACRLARRGRRALRAPDGVSLIRRRHP